MRLSRKLKRGGASIIEIPQLAARHQGSPLDRFAVGIASLGVAIPQFWLGLLLILLFAVQLGWLPAMGARSTASIVLPALTLGLGVAASLTRIIRSGLLEARGQGFFTVVQTARRPGLGDFLVSAIFARDFPQVQAVVLLTAVLFVVINLLIDIFYQVLDPRIGEHDA